MEHKEIIYRYNNVCREDEALFEENTSHTGSSFAEAFPSIQIKEGLMNLKQLRKTDPEVEAMVVLGDSAMFDPAYDKLQETYGNRIFSGMRRVLPQMLYSYHNCYLPQNLPQALKESLSLIAPDVAMKDICVVCSNDALTQAGMTTGIVVTCRALYYRLTRIKALENIHTVGFLPLDGIVSIQKANKESDHEYVVAYANGMLRLLYGVGEYLPELFRAISHVFESCRPSYQDTHLDIRRGLQAYYDAREREGLNAYHNSFFVSSTFKDMHYERDAIHDRILPALNRLGAAYGQSISFCDLRWGVDTGNLESEEGARKVLTVCLDEIERCKPHMVVLLGSRYGWIPDQELIAESIYGRDGFWLDDLEKSVTALEVEFGALSKSIDRERIFVYFRTLEGCASEQYLAEDSYHALKLEELKKRIRAVCGDRIRNYSLLFDDSGNLVSGIEEFSSMILADLEKSLLKDWEKEAKLSPEEKEFQFHENYAGRKALQCNAREDLLLDLASRIDGGDSYLALIGPSGSGKSTVMAALGYVLRGSGAEVLPLFCGLTGNSDQSVEILQMILYSLETRLHMDHIRPKQEEGTVLFLRRRINDAAAAYLASDFPRLVILIDAVDQLLEDSLRDSLQFLPDTTGDRLNILLSCTEEFHVPYGPVVIELPPTEGIEPVVQGILKLYRRELERPVLEAISAKRGAKLPLYISLLIERLLMMNKEDFEAIVQAGDGMAAISAYQCALVEHAPDDLNAMGVDILTAAASRISGPIVAEATAYLAASRHGLRDTDLEQLFRRKGLSWNTLDLSLYLHYIAGLFLFRTDGRIDFSHKVLREGFYSRESDPSGRHREIALHLQALPDGDPVKETELFYHIIYSGDIVALRSYIDRLPEKKLFENYLAKLLSDACLLPDSTLLQEMLSPANAPLPGPRFLQFMAESFYIIYQRNAAGRDQRLFADNLVRLARLLLKDRSDQLSRVVLILCLQCRVRSYRTSRDDREVEEAKRVCCELIDMSSSLYEASDGLCAGDLVLYAYDSLANIQNRLGEPQESVQATYQKAVELAEAIYPVRKERSVRERRMIGQVCYDVLFGPGAVPSGDIGSILKKAQDVLEENAAEIGASEDLSRLGYLYEGAGFYYRDTICKSELALQYFKKQLEVLERFLKEDYWVYTLKRLANAALSIALRLKEMDAEAHQQEILQMLESSESYFHRYCKEAKTDLAEDFNNIGLTWSNLAQAYQKEDSVDSKRKCRSFLDRALPQVKEMLQKVPKKEQRDLLDTYCTLLNAALHFTPSSEAGYAEMTKEILEVLEGLYKITGDPLYKKMRKYIKSKQSYIRLANIVTKWTI